MNNFSLLKIAAVVCLLSGSLTACGGDGDDAPAPATGTEVKLTVVPEQFAVSSEAATLELKVKADRDWAASTDADWVTVRPSGGVKDVELTVELTVKPNPGTDARSTSIDIRSGGKVVKSVALSQEGVPASEETYVPEGYKLVWADEFDGGPALGPDWVAENWPSGYVNNELQNYTGGYVDGKPTLEVKDGCLNITCFKANDGKIYSGRVNAMPSKGWLYGYFEARINLPKGRGTWPAFWMMPSNVDWSTNGWPRCGEIDIMEEVGANPNYVSSSLHTENYNHTKGTQKTHEMYCAGAEGEFHVYALEWTEEEIITYVDGKQQLRATRASMGTDHASWPFHYPFYPILNLAWGGDWGGYKGVDDAVLPVTMKIDYVRIFQKK